MASRLSARMIGTVNVPISADRPSIREITMSALAGELFHTSTVLKRK